MGEVFTKTFNLIARLLGFSGESMDPDRTAVGAAARHARFAQPKEIADDAIKNALMMSIGGPKKKTPVEHLDAIEKAVGKIHDFMEMKWGKGGAAAAGADVGGNAAKDGGTGGVGQRAFRYRLARGAS